VTTFVRDAPSRFSRLQETLASYCNRRETGRRGLSTIHLLLASASGFDENRGDSERISLPDFNSHRPKLLGINMFAVERDHIKNEHLRNKLSVYNITDMIRNRQSNYIGKLARMPSNRLPRRMMGSWLPCKRKPGGLQATTARTYVATMQELLGRDQCSDHGHFSDWIYFAESEKDWNRTRNDYMSQTRKKCARLGTSVLGPAVYSEWMVTTGPASF